MTTRERPSSARPGRPGMRPPRARYVPKRKVCFFCVNKNEVIDYKNPEKLRSYVSDRAKIDPRRRTGTCAKHQRAMATAIKRARHLALLPYISDHIFTGPIAGQTGQSIQPAQPSQSAQSPPQSPAPPAAP